MNLRSAPKDPTYDLVVIGGGINGAAIARDAALRGLSVCLLEKDDFGSGASSKTSKLAHGGLRYLEGFHFSLVREALRERELLFNNAPHLVHPLSFLIPVYEDGPNRFWVVRLGLFIYDLLGCGRTVPKHAKLDRKAIQQAFPDLKMKGLNGGCLYYDGQMADARLVIENVLSAEEAGAIVRNYCLVERLLYADGRVHGVSCVDRLNGKRFEVYGHVVVNATGAWSGYAGGIGSSSKATRIAPSKGVHLVVPKIHADTALLLRAPQDGRVFFVIPWGEESLIGTTDTFFDGDPDVLEVTQTDRSYLLDAFNAYFPDRKIHEGEIIASFAGLRPLVAAVTDDAVPSNVGREHLIEKSKDGLITISGGKYTTHRLVAEEVVDQVVASIGSSRQFSPCSTVHQPLPGAQGPLTFEEVRKHLAKMGLPDDVVEHLMTTYGTRSLKVTASLKDDPSAGIRICPLHPHLFAEIDYAVLVEHARKLDDWSLRRTAIGYGKCGGEHCKKRTAGRFDAALKRLESKDNSIAEISTPL